MERDRKTAVVPEYLVDDAAGEIVRPAWLRNPSIPQIYDYLLSRKNDSEVDRDLADKIVARLPTLPIILRANRRFPFLAVRRLVASLGNSATTHVCIHTGTGPVYARCGKPPANAL